MNNVLGGQYSPVNNVQGDSIHRRMMSGGTILGGTLCTDTGVNPSSFALRIYAELSCVIPVSA